MKIHTFIQYLVIVILLQFAFPQTITNFQQKIENGRIVVTYDLQGKTLEKYNINLTAKNEGDSVIPKAIAGDLNDVSPGKHKVIWWEPVLESRSLTGWHITLTTMPLINMVYIPGGTFEMGCGSWTNDCEDDEKPVHTVTVSSLYMSSTEVTQDQWQAVMGTNPSIFKGDDLPVESVSWDDVQEFLTKLNQKTSQNYRLPTEAEWEYAARSGGKKEKYAGTNSNLDEYAWYIKNSGNKTHPVGQKKPNGLGLYDMSGNVWEWCSDWYDKDYYKNSLGINPKGTYSGSLRVLRGGSWDNYDISCRLSFRKRNLPNIRSNYRGFRFAQDL